MNNGRWWLALALVGCGTNKPPDPEPSKVARLELSCPRHSVTAFDPTRTLLAGPSIPCSARVSDVAGAPLAGVQLHLLAEAGRLNGGASNTEGVVELLHEVSLPVPLDVEPADARIPRPNDTERTGQPWAPAWMHPEGWGAKPTQLFGPQMMGREPSRPDPIRITDAGRLILNPRDNLVTLVAWVDGSEPLDDINGNGQQDEGETFVDLTEPFVDANDDGTWNQGEAFVDSNANGKWDGKNLIWDRQTKLWAQERVLWTGLPASQDMQALPSVTMHRRVAFGLAPTLVCPPLGGGCASALPNGPNMLVQFYMADPWFNAMTRTSATAGCEVLSLDASPLVTYGVPTTTLDSSNDAPDGVLGSVSVTDVRDPNSPSTNPPLRAPALGYRGAIACEVSDGSPGGHMTFMTVFESTIE